MDLFVEIALVVCLAAFLGIICYRFKQPTVIGYLLAGIVVGPLGLLKLNNLDVVDGLSEIGIALLLFLVGLEMNVYRLKEVGRPAILAGLGQLIFTFTVGFGITKLLGFSDLSSTYVSFALTLSSTIIVVQLLSQKKDLESLYGKIVVGLLLIQDFVAIAAIIFLSGLAGAGSESISTLTFSVIGALVKGFVLVYATILLSRKVFPRVLNYLGASQEILFLFSLAWGLGLAAVMSSPWAGFSIEIGGFLAGLALANSITHFQIAGRIKPIRDFFIMFFFVTLGAKLAVGHFAVVLAPAVILTLFVLVGNPIIVMFIMSSLGYRSRTSFLASITVAQISEFSLIIAANALRLGHISQAEASLITLVGIATITASSYFIMHGDSIYLSLKRLLKIFEFRKIKVEKTGAIIPLNNHVVLVGAHRMGGNIIDALEKTRESFVVVDFDPVVANALIKKKTQVIYGDISEDEIKRLARLGSAKIVISTVPDFNDSANLIAFMKRENSKAKVVVTGESDWQARELYNMGAAYVILPHFLGGVQIAEVIKNDHAFVHLARLREHDLATLR